jgi:hypothetical protein
MKAIAAWWARLSLGGQLAWGVVAAAMLWLLWATIGIRLVILLWTGRWLPWRIDETAFQQLGQVGDLFGGVNALFAAFAFVGVAIAAYYQHRTFKLQHDQQRMLVDQHALQIVEPLFFKLLDGARTPGTLRVRRGSPTDISEEDPFSQAVAKFRKSLSRTWDLTQSQHPSEPVRWDEVDLVYRALFDDNENDLAPYFRRLYHIFKLVAHSQLSLPDKFRYAHIARDDMNRDQLLLLAVHGQTDEGKGLRQYIEGFGLLRHLFRREDAEPQNVEQRIAALYTPSAIRDQKGRMAYWEEHPDEYPEWA